VSTSLPASLPASYERSGRTAQKGRTRAALIAAARALVARGGEPPTVEQVATEAAISRTTAYRYFPNQKAMLRAAHPETEATTLLPADIGDDPEARLRAAVDAFSRLIIDTEAQQRTMLRLSLEPDAAADRLPLRQGRAIGWFEDALAPLRRELPAAAIHRLAVAVRNATGIESLVWLTDVAGLSHDEARELMQWSAVAMLHATLTEQPGRPEPGPAGDASS
jgi:AcrR family transcriptional regulator